jgi:hypothetical protein
MSTGTATLADRSQFVAHPPATRLTARLRQPTRFPFSYRFIHSTNRGGTVSVTTVIRRLGRLAESHRRVFRNFKRSDCGHRKGGTQKVRESLRRITDSLDRPFQNEIGSLKLKRYQHQLLGDVLPFERRYPKKRFRAKRERSVSTWRALAFHLTKTAARWLLEDSNRAESRQDG